MTKYNKKMIEQLILQELGTPNVDKIVKQEIEEQEIVNQQLSQQQKLTTQPKRVLAPDQVAVQKTNYDLLKKAAINLNTEINKRNVRDVGQIIDLINQFISQVSAL